MTRPEGDEADDAVGEDAVASGGRAVVATALVFVLAALSGGYLLGAHPFWQDEAATMSATARTWGQLADLLGHQDRVFAVYYGFLHVFRRLGDSTTWVRVPSLVGLVIASATTVPVARRAGATVPVAALAGALVAVNPFMAVYAREARPYTLAAAASTLMLLAALRAAERPTAGRLAAWLLAGVLTIALQFLVGVSVVLAAGWLVAQHRRDRRVRLAAAAGLVAFLGWAVALGGQAGQVAYLAAEPKGYRIHTTTDVLGGDAPAAGLLLLFGVAVLATPRDPRCRVRVLVLGSAAAAPPVLAVAEVIKPVYAARYLIQIVPLLAVGIALGLQAVAHGLASGRSAPARGRRGLRTSGPALGAAAAIALTALAVGLVQTRAHARAAYFEDDPVTVAAALSAQVQAGDLIVYQSNIARPLMELYLPAATVAALHDVLLDRPGPVTGTFPGTRLPLSRVQPQLAAAPRVWFLHLGPPADAEETATKVLLDRTHQQRTAATGGEIGLDIYTRPPGQA